MRSRRSDVRATRIMALQRRDSDLDIDVKMDDVEEGSRSPPQLLQDDKAITVRFLVRFTCPAEGVPLGVAALSPGTMWPGGHWPCKHTEMHTRHACMHHLPRLVCAMSQGSQGQLQLAEQDTSPCSSLSRHPALCTMPASTRHAPAHLQHPAAAMLPLLHALHPIHTRGCTEHTAP